MEKKEDVCNNSPTSHKHFSSERLHSNDSKEVKCYTKQQQNNAGVSRIGHMMIT